MDEKTLISTLVSVAVGAVAASVPKLWDILSERQKHKQGNQKLYFERKLNVLQTYVAVCTQLSAANFHNALAIKRIMHVSFFDDDDVMNIMVIQHFDNNVKNNQEVVARLTEVSSAVSMFIDLKIDEVAAYSLIEAIHTGVATLGRVKGEVDEVIGRFQLQGEPSPDSIQGKEYFRKKAAYESLLVDISNNYEKLKLDLNRCINVVRDEFKKYES